MKKFRFGLEWPPAASGPQKSTMNRICGRRPGPGARGPKIWVNYSIHGPRPGRRYRKKIPRFGLEWPPAASGPPESCPNRYWDGFFPSFIKFHCNRTIFEVFFRSGGRGAHVCYSLPRSRGRTPVRRASVPDECLQLFAVTVSLPCETSLCLKCLSQVGRREGSIQTLRSIGSPIAGRGTIIGPILTYFRVREMFKRWFWARLPPNLRSGGVGTYLVFLAMKNCTFSFWHFFKRP